MKLLMMLPFMILETERRLSAQLISLCLLLMTLLILDVLRQQTRLVIFLQWAVNPLWRLLF